MKAIGIIAAMFAGVACAQDMPVTINLSTSPMFETITNAALTTQNSGIGNHVRVQQIAVGADPIFGCDLLRGSFSAPTAVQLNDILCSFHGRGYDGTTMSAASAQLRAIVTENWSSTAHGSMWIITATRNGTTTEDTKEQVDGAAHTDFKCAGCVGTSSNGTVKGNDTVARITLATATGSFTYTFNEAWVYPPVCHIVDETKGTVLGYKNPTTTTINIVGSMAASDVLGVDCKDYNYTN